MFKDKSLAADINIVLAGLMFLNGNEVGTDLLLICICSSFP